MNHISLTPSRSSADIAAHREYVDNPQLANNLLTPFAILGRPEHLGHRPHSPVDHSSLPYVETPGTVTIGNIAEQLLTDSLIDACELRADHVVIIQDAKRRSFSYEQAHAFMTGMLRGRPWSTAPLSAGDGAGADQLPDLVRERGPNARSLAKAVDELGAMALDLRLIEKWERTADGAVKIVLASCETELAEEAAAAYFADCVLTKLRSMAAEAPRFGLTRSGAWSPDRQLQPVLPDN